MTEEFENVLVHVRAQVMSRNDVRGGWVAMGGGLSDVVIGQRTPAGSTNDSDTDTSSTNSALPEYYIHGIRISDSKLVLDCTIKKDLEYKKVMPTFHHWTTDEKRYALTFQSAADGRAFDRAVQTAFEDVMEGWLVEGLARLNAQQKIIPAPKNTDENEKIFEELNLPSDSISSPEISACSRSKQRADPTPIRSAITVPPKLSRFRFELVDDYEDEQEHSLFPKVRVIPRHDSARLSSAATITEIVPTPTMADADEQQPGTSGSNRGSPACHARNKQPNNKCRHCYAWYTEQDNVKGACSYAPDSVGDFIDKVSCIKCAQCLTYHCLTEPEGDLPAHPCDCAPLQGSCAKRWLGISLLSLFVPCLCLYAPLHGLHVCARAVRLAGGAHVPIFVPQTSDDADGGGDPPGER